MVTGMIIDDNYLIIFDIILFCPLILSLFLLRNYSLVVDNMGK